MVSDYTLPSFYYLLECAQADSARNQWIKNVPVLRDDHVEFKSRLPGMWQVARSRKVDGSSWQLGRCQVTLTLSNISGEPI